MLADGLDPVLEFHQLDLQRALEVLILAPRHLLGVGVILTPRVDRPAVRPEQHWVVVLIVVVHPESSDQDGVGRPVIGQRIEQVGCFISHGTSTPSF
jgi:hypothetical protein